MKLTRGGSLERVAETALGHKERVWWSLRLVGQYNEVVSPGLENAGDGAKDGLLVFVVNADAVAYLDISRRHASSPDGFVSESPQEVGNGVKGSRNVVNGKHGFIVT